MSIHEEAEPVATPEVPWVTQRVGRATVVESAEFVEHLVTLTRTGLPLPSGLRALASELPSKRLRHALVATADRIELGTSLDAAMIELADRFPVHLRGLIVAGAESGKLADVLGQYVRYASLGENLRRRFRLVIAYPAFLVCVLGALYLFLCHSIVQAFEFILKDFGINIPAITSALFLLARVTRERGLGLLIAVAVIGGIGLVSARFLAGPIDRRRIILGIPLYGPMLRWSVLAEYCHMVGLLVESEMPLPEALELAGQGVNDPALAKTGMELRRSVEHGRTLSESLVLWPSCPAGLREVLDGSEDRGDLSPSLHMAGDMFEARAQAQASFASTLIAVFTVLFVVWGIGFVITALYMPMINLISRLSG